MVVCRYFQQGNCRFGNNCKFEHPRDGNSGQQSPFGGGGNRFSALSGGQSAFGGSKQSDQPEYAGLNEETIRKDLQDELPQWIFSCYGPGKDAPDNLFGGYPREQQPEEIRLHFMRGQMAGEADAALNEIMQLHTVARQQIEHTLSNIPAAIKHVREGVNRHPNRHDICKQGTPAGTGSVFGQPAANPFGSAAQSASNPFGAPSQPATTAGGFGQPTALGQKPNPFGAPAFGQPAQPAANPSPFGQPAAPSAFGQPAAPSAFGQPAALGASTNPFGKPAGGAFGQPSALGGTSKVFGQAATPAFGQSGFGQTTQAPSAFGQPAALGATQSPFAAAAANTTQQNAGPFGQAQQQAQKPSPFGQPAAPSANPFGQPAANPSPFGAPQSAAAPTASPFGQAQQPAQSTPSPFGPPAAPATNPFGQPAQAAATPSPFGQPATTTAAPSPFGQTAAAPAPSPFVGATAAATQPTPQQGQGPYGPGATRTHPPLSSYASKNPDGTLRMFKGKPVMYEVVKSQGEKPVPVIKNFDGTVMKIWNPNGAPNYTTETEAEPEKYNDPKVQHQWAMFVETGRFEGGVMPEVPPKREFCVWNF
ncbi:hypothetical protein QBC40DRAFT_272513 [Triangularia verruculosa]|uniref:C3H1-type domain-containing protein n=1 Tax=Triangularia verruculosa TaxID=2587418 RepID=A0AAN7AX21_9PEZI|nr:hypothetical protein QBC40DRAFT_272513 [Triangularia verruculosa]